MKVINIINEKGTDYCRLIELCIENAEFSIYIDPWYKKLKVTKITVGLQYTIKHQQHFVIDEPEKALKWINEQLNRKNKDE